MRISIRALRYFLVAAERGSIAGAATVLNVVPSAISKAIEDVEAEFDLKLLQRYPAKGIKPTAAGAAMMRKVRRLLEEYDSLLLEGAELRESLSGDFSLGYYAPVAPAFVPPVAAALIRDNPHVRLRLVECDNERAQSGLVSGEFDLIVFVAENVATGIACEPLLEAPPYLLAPARHPLADRDAVSFYDVADLPLVLLDLPLTRSYYRSLLDERGIEPRIVATASSTEMVRSLVGAGVGCALLNMRPRTRVAYSGRKLAALPIRPAARPLKLVLGHLGDRPRRLTRAFIDALCASFARADARDLIVS